MPNLLQEYMLLSSPYKNSTDELWKIFHGKVKRVPKKKERKKANWPLTSCSFFYIPPQACFLMRKGLDDGDKTDQDICVTLTTPFPEPYRC